jgi:hypothetical protein
MRILGINALVHDPAASPGHRRHGWRRAQARRGRLPGHLAVTAVAGGALPGAALGRRRATAALAAAWPAGTAEVAWAGISPGLRTRDEVLTAMVVTSAAVPSAATAHWMRGSIRHRSVTPVAADEQFLPATARPRWI